MIVITRFLWPVNRMLARSRKKPGPPATVVGTLIGVRLHPPDLTALDEWASEQEDKPSRPEAVRGLLKEALGAGKKKPRSS